jgi:hypothetical protein
MASGSSEAAAASSASDLLQTSPTAASHRPQRYSLRWKNYACNLTNVFDRLLATETLVDMTLATTDGCDPEGSGPPLRAIRCHRVVLSACSPYLAGLLAAADAAPNQHPIIVLKDVSWTDLTAIVRYMYRGEISVDHEDLPSILRTAEELQIRGLVDFGADSANNNNSTNGDGEHDRVKTNGNHELEMIEAPTNDEGDVGMMWRPEFRGSALGSSSRRKRKQLSGSPQAPASPKMMSSSHSPANAPFETTPTATPPGLFPAPSTSKHMHMARSMLGPEDYSDVKPGIVELIQEERRVSLLSQLRTVQQSGIIQALR